MAKTNDATSVIKDAKVLKVKPEPVRQAVEVKGAAAKAIAQQLTSDGVVGTSSSPKSRARNYWGREER